MSVIKRISDILSANLSELIERYEDPELLLKQAVREMEESIRAALENAAKVVGHEKILARQLTEEEKTVGVWQQRATEAIQRGNEDDARKALRQKLEHETIARSIAAQLTEVTTAGQTLRCQIESMRRRVEEAQRKLVLLAARQRAAEARQRLLREFGDIPLGNEAFDKFDRMCRRVERTEAEADALAELTRGSRGQTTIEADLSATESELELELRELKAQIQAAT